MQTIERWGVLELSFPGRAEGNPFVDCAIHATFSGAHETIRAEGFYDGDGAYRVRFMPSFEGEYRYHVEGTFSDKAYDDAFLVTPARAGNHGPVRARGFHFEHEDGTPFFPVGTTCYVWELQRDDLVEKTLEELAKGYFNKIRFCVFPKHYLYNLHEPASYPFEGTAAPFDIEIKGSFYAHMGVTPGHQFDFGRFNPAHFRRVEQSVARLGELGVEADVILFHPYDRWGFSHMSAERDARYLRYVTARLSAYRNVWWSLANEYDLLRDKTIADWENLAQVLLDADPYRRLRSIHNCLGMYDYTRPWITHCSIQRQDLYKCAEYVDDFRTRYGKPVVLDEIAYEGDLEQGWGNITGEELVRRFWEAALRGGYATHGETFDRPDQILWWSHGGTLHGESPARLKFLLDILKQTPGAGLRRAQGMWDEVAATAEGMGDSGYYLYYYGFGRPCKRMFMMPGDRAYKAEIIDTWNMTIEDAGEHRGMFFIELPRRPYMAVRLTAIS